MKKLIINGQHELSGTIKIGGAKNSVVGVVPATIVSNGKCKIYNVPNISDVEKLNEMLEREQYPNLKGPLGKLLHSETKYMARRMWKREYEALINLLEYNKKNNIEMSDEELLLILTAGGAYATPGILDITIDNYKEYVIPILEKYGYTIPDNFFEGLEDEPETKKVIMASPFDGSLIVDGPEWETELRNRTIKLIKEYQYTDANNTTKKK